MDFTVTHVTRFAYQGPVSESTMEVRLVPRSDGRQEVPAFEMTTNPAATIFSYVDAFGNDVRHFDIVAPHLELVVHTRAAAEDTLRIMREEGAGEAGGVMHCFTETLEVARAAVDMGFHVSFSGIVTFKNAGSLREVAKALPLERILVETDSPYLAPVPHRGKVNEPAYVRHVAETMAAIRGLSLEALADATTANFFRLFRLTESETLV